MPQPRAHLEYPCHVACDAGNVEKQRLVEASRVLSRRKGDTHASKGGRAEREVSGKRAAGPVSGLKEGGQGTQAELTKNIQRMVVTLDVSKLRG